MILLKPGDRVFSTWHKKEATFQAWGLNYDELEFGAGIFSTAIIIFDDGKIDSIIVDSIELVDSERK